MSLNSSDLIKSSLIFTKDNLLPLAAVGVMLMAPYAFASERAGHSVLVNGFSAMTVVWYLLMLVLSISGTFLLQACVVTAYFERDPSGKVQLDRAVQRALRRLGPMILTSLLTGVAIVAGYICLIVPGIILIFGLSAAVPMSIAEDIDPIDALKGSWELTKGHKFDIFVTMFLFGLLMIPVMLVMAIVAGLVGFVANFVLPGGMVQVLTLTLVMAIMNLPGQVLFAKIYESLRTMGQTPQAMDYAPGYAPQAPGYAPQAMGAPPAGPPAQ